MTTTVTVFGGSGFIGHAIVQRLARLGMIVRVPTRDMDAALTLKPAGNVAQIAPFLCSLHDDGAVTRAIAGSDIVINLIGVLFEKSAASFQCVHVEMAARLARIAHEQGVKNFIHFSALGASSESNSKYARSKAAGEAAVRMFFPQATILRPSVVFGPEDNFINQFAGLARFAPALPLIGGGHTKFQPVYVGDIADVVAQIATTPSTQGAVYEIGGPTIYSFRQIIEYIVSQLGRNCLLLNLPWALAKFMAFFMEFLPHPMLTRDQVELLKSDAIISTSGTKTLRNLGITPTAMEQIAPSYLLTYGRAGALKSA